MEIVAKAESINEYITHRYSVFRDVHCVGDVEQTPPVLPNASLIFERTGNKIYREEKEDGETIVSHLPEGTVKVTFVDGDNQTSAIFKTLELIECLKAADPMARIRRDDE